MERMSEKQFRNKIITVSFVLACCIVWFHAHNLVSYNFGPKDGILECIVCYIEDIVHSIGEIGVPFFFVISGYLFFRNYALRDTLKKWKSRFFTIAVLSLFGEIFISSIYTF